MKQLDYTRKELNIGKIFIITFMLALLITALTGCAITYETPKCELMLRGEECLSDHRCCNPPRSYNYRTYPNWHWWGWNKPVVNKTIIINKPNNKPNRPNNRPNRPNNKPNSNKGKKR